MEFLSSDFMPHGQCYLWQPNLLFSHVAADLVIAGSYFSIPIAIVWFLSRRDDIKFRAVFYLFAAFILLCGITHLYSVYVIWVGQYGVQAILKGLTAAVSFATAIAIYRYLPDALSIPTREQWETMKEMAFEKRQAEESQSFFHTITDSLTSGILVADRQLNIVMANASANELLGSGDEKILNHSVSEFVPKTVSHHPSLANQFFEMPREFQHPMAKGRKVKAVDMAGEELEVQVKLTQFDYLNQALVAVVLDAPDQTKKSENSEKYERTLRSLDSVRDGAWEWNIETNEVWWNARHAELMGVDPDAAPSFEIWEEHVHPEDRKRVLEYLQETVANGTDYNIEYLGRASDKTYQWFRSRGKMYFADGKPAIISGMLSNIQYSHDLEKELNQKTDFLNRLINLSVAGLYVFDFNQNKNTYINQAYTRLLGYELEDLEQMDNLMEVFHPDEIELLLDHMKSVQSEPEKSHELIYRFKHKAGHWVWCLSQDSVNEVDEEGKPVSMLGTFIDITDLKEKESSIQEWAASFYSIFNQAAVGIAQVALDGSFIRVNKKVCDMWGYSEAEVLTKTFQELTHPDDLESDLDKVNELLEGEEDSYTLEKRYIRADGDVFWALLTVKVVRDVHYKPLHFISVIEDIASIKDTERALSDSNQALEAFAFTASHDLQEPLRKIKTFAGLVEKRLQGKLEDPEAKYELSRLKDASERLSRLISSILDLARVSKQELELTKVSLSDMANAAMSAIGYDTPTESVQWRVEENIEFMADNDSMARVFQNLFSNAIKYQTKGEPSELTLTGWRESGWVHIAVSDNGPGIPAKDAETVFAPFKRLVGRELQGSGMGLAICKQIVRKHNGTIEIDTSQGSGLRMIIRLPEGQA